MRQKDDIDMSIQKTTRRESAAMGEFRAQSACFLEFVIHIDIFGVF